MKAILITPLLLISVLIQISANAQTVLSTTKTKQNMEQTKTKSDENRLLVLNVEFIKNFTTMDTVSHNKIIHKDFVCINSDGTISDRVNYMKGWATGYKQSGYTSFSITDESVRIFGDMALVRSRTVYTKEVDGETVQGSSVYTDTYVKENGEWLCVQAHITPVKK